MVDKKRGIKLRKAFRRRCCIAFNDRSIHSSETMSNDAYNGAAECELIDGSCSESERDAGIFDARVYQTAANCLKG